MTRHHLLITAALCAMPFAARAQSTAAPLLACFVPKSGTMYVVAQPGAPDKCRTTDHVLLQWNAVGPAGPTGAAGAPGPVGPQGPAGTATLTGSTALTGIEMITTSTDIAPLRGANIKYITQTCPQGKIAIGGGVLSLQPYILGQSLTDTSYMPQVAGSYPNAAYGFSNREWVIAIFIPFTANQGATGPVLISTTAICAKVN